MAIAIAVAMLLFSSTISSGALQSPDLLSYPTNNNTIALINIHLNP